MLNKSHAMIGCVAALALSALAAGQGKLQAVKPDLINGKQEVQVVGTGLGQPKLMPSSGKKIWKFVFDGSLAGRPSEKSVRKNGLRYWVCGWLDNKPPKVFVMLYFSAPCDPQVTQSQDGWTISWGESAIAAKAAGALAFETAKPAEAVAAKAEAPVALKQPKAVKSDFPATVPPLELFRKIQPTESASRPVIPASPLEAKVDLVFVNTEVVQILRALAQQADVNIVTSPEVTGKITVSLNQVTVQSALDFVTTMANLRYARLGNAFIVTSNARFANAMLQMKNQQDTPSETRVINLLSGEGNQIKASVFKAIPQDTMQGHYDLVLPSEKLSITQKSEEKSSDDGAAGGQGGQGGQGAQGGQQGQATTAIQSQAQDVGIGPIQANKDPYLVLVGTRARLDDVETMIRDLDTKIVTAARLGVTANIGTRVIPVYSAQVTRIKEAVKALVDRDPKKDSFSVADTQTSPSLGVNNALMMLLVSGPQEALDIIADFATSLDRAICDANGTLYPRNAAEAERKFEVVDLKFVEPLEAAFEVQKRVQGLQASLMPASADPQMSGGGYERRKDPTLWTRREAKGQRLVGDGGAQTASSGSNSSQAAAAGGGGGGGGATGAAQGGAAGQAGGGSSAVSGAAGVSIETRSLGYEPMQLILHGTSAQIAQAKKLLAVMDTAPKQVAIEIRVMSLSKEEALRIGLDWSLITGGSVRTLRLNQGTGDNVGTPGTVSGTLGFAGGGSLDILNSLDKLAGTSKMIARPNLLAINGKPSSLFVGDRIQYIKSIQASQNGQSIEVGELNVGVEMIVIPRVGDQGNLILDIAPALTILKGFTPVPNGGNLPQTTERYAQSQIVMKSGETIAIGGLIQDEDRKSRSGIPLLQDLPIFGQLFSRTDNNRTRTEIVFFLTAKEVSAEDRGNAANPTPVKPDKVK